MNVQTHEELKAKIWEIANRLRGPYRPPQYRLVMLPMVVLRRLDCVLEPTKDAVLKRRDELEAKQMPEAALDRLLGKAADPNRNHALYNTSPYTFARLLGDAENIAPNLVSYINGFSATARHIFERFKFADQIEKLDASNRLFTVVKAMTDVDLHPDRIDNLQMGYLFEHLVMRFNEQSNEEAGDHFTPREVIRLMANLIYTGEQDVYKPGIFRTIYDPACGTGGMLSESEKLILSQNERAQLALFGQDYNDESWAICRSDMLIKDEDTANIVLGDTLGDGKTRDGFEGERFHYLMANPPFGVEWKDQKDAVQREHRTVGLSGRFGAGLPAIDDGSLLFLQHMISKMHPYEEGDEDQPGSKIAIVFNGSPLFSGDAGSGPSNIRRWIIENDWLDAIVALPDQLFYNTGIFTYVWLVTNRKAPERRGKVQLIDGTRLFEKDEEEPQQQAQRDYRGANLPPDPRIRKLPGRRQCRSPHRRKAQVPRHLPHLREPGVRLPQSDGRTPLADELRGDAGADCEARRPDRLHESGGIERSGRTRQRPSARSRTGRSSRTLSAPCLRRSKATGATWTAPRSRPM